MPYHKKKKMKTKKVGTTKKKKMKEEERAMDIKGIVTDQLKDRQNQTFLLFNQS